VDVNSDAPVPAGDRKVAVAISGGGYRASAHHSDIATGRVTDEMVVEAIQSLRSRLPADAKQEHEVTDVEEGRPPPAGDWWPATRAGRPPVSTNPPGTGTST
jgi:hypothetical protein